MIKIWAKIYFVARLGLIIATPSFAGALGQKMVDDFGESMGGDDMLMVDATQEAEPTTTVEPVQSDEISAVF